MAFIVLIRHAKSVQQTDTSAHNWHLAQDGRAQCIQVARRLQKYEIGSMHSSDEPKAQETAELIAGELSGVGVQLNRALRETQRQSAPFYADVQDFRRAIQTAMERPQEVVYGEEAFEAARQRFAGAIQTIVEGSSGHSTGVVSHGTIMALYMADVMGMRPYDLWKLMDMPAYAVFRLADMKIMEICFSAAEA